MSQILKQVSENNWPPQDGANNQVTLSSLLADLTTRFCSGSRWMLRQSYVNICNQLVTDRALPLEDFAKLLLSPLLALRQDRVPNVRLVLARVINFQLKYHGILIIDYFQTQLFIIFLCLFILQSSLPDQIVLTGNRWTRRSTSCLPTRTETFLILPLLNVKIFR